VHSWPRTYPVSRTSIIFLKESATARLSRPRSPSRSSPARPHNTERGTVCYAENLVWAPNFRCATHRVDFPVSPRPARWEGGGRAGLKHRRFGRGWSDFTGWCAARRLRPLPAHPWTVAAYARWCESRHRIPTILERVQTIARAHVLMCLKPPDCHPTVTRTLRAIEACNRRRRRRRSLFPDGDFSAGAAAESAPIPAAGTVLGESAAETDSEKSHRRRGMRRTPRLVRRRPKTS
jgi:hypothetical protein